MSDGGRFPEMVDLRQAEAERWRVEPGTYSTPRWVGVSGGPDYLWMASVCMVCGKISAECECGEGGRRDEHMHRRQEVFK